MSDSSMPIIRGIHFPPSSWCKNVARIEETLDYTPNDGDIVLASYPKTGSTLMQFIVHQIVSKGEALPSFDDILTKYMPNIEITGMEVVEGMKPPRIYRHHYPYYAVNKNKNAKYLYVYRNPADAFVSMLHFMKELKTAMEGLDEFFERYISDKFVYGGIFEHVLSYWKHKDDDNMLIVSYERLVEDRKREILRIAGFLGEEYFRILTEDDGRLLELIVERTEFDYMKKNLPVSRVIQSPTETLEVFSGQPPKVINFFRKGTTGDGKKTLSEDQLKRLKEVAAEAC